MGLVWWKEVLAYTFLRAIIFGVILGVAVSLGLADPVDALKLWAILVGITTFLVLLHHILGPGRGPRDPF